MQTYVCALTGSADALCLHFIVCEMELVVACLHEANVMVTREDI